MASYPKKTTQITKKHLARIERERLQTRYILIGSIIVIVAVLSLIGYGILDQTVLRDMRSVAIVNGDKIRSDHFVAQTRYYRSNLIRNAENTYQLAQYFGSDASSSYSFANQVGQIQQMLDPTTAGEARLNQLIDDTLIRQEANRRGITVTDEEITKAFEAAFGYFPSGTNTPTSSLSPIPTSTLSQLQLTLIPPTATATITPTFTSTPTLTQTATLPPTQTTISKLPTITTPISTTFPITGVVLITPTQTATFTPLPTNTATSTPTTTSTATPTATATEILPTSTASNTPTPYTFEAYQKNYQNAVDRLQKDNNISEKELRYVIESQLYREKVMQAIVGDLPHTQEEVWALHILVADESTAKDMVNRLSQGEEWGQLASNYSTDTSNKDKGGDLGWFGKGKMTADFENAVFAAKIGNTGIVKTEFGWHVYRILGHEDRPVADSDYTQLQQTKFTDWLKQLRDSGTVQIFDVWKEIVPSDPIMPQTITDWINQALGGGASLPTLP
jgi:peptidyl-prolyl cis-trans isomerase D